MMRILLLIAPTPLALIALFLLSSCNHCVSEQGCYFGVKQPF